MSEGQIQFLSQIKFSIWYRQNLSDYVENLIYEKSEKVIKFFFSVFKSESISFDSEMGVNYFSWTPNRSKSLLVVEIISSVVFVSVYGNIPHIIC